MDDRAGLWHDSAMHIGFTFLAQADPSIDWVMLAIKLVGGLAVFLFGMSLMTDALKIVAGEGMRRLLTRLTGNRFTATISGVVITGLTQSSSVTTVLLVGFVAAGLMTLSQSIGVIIGSNIGSTFTAQLIAFNVTQYALAVVALGFFVQMFSRRSAVRQVAGVVLGLGLVFFGMALMSDATYPLRSYPPFIDLMEKMDNPLLGVLAGLVFTAIVQSSAATTGLVIVLGSQGLISLDGAIAVALGANVGTCVTAMLAAIGKPRAALQVAFVHVLFNVLGVLLWLAFIPQLAELSRDISPADPANPAEALPRQIANAHTLFNVINAAIFLCFTGALARLTHWVLPEKAEAEPPPAAEPKFLNDAALQTPGIALDYARRELARCARRVFDMFELIPDAMIDARPDALDRLAQRRKEITELDRQILLYLGKLSQLDVTRHQVTRIENELAIANHFEDLAQIIEEDIVRIGRDRIAEGIIPSESTREKIIALYAAVLGALGLAVETLETGDPDPARAALDRKPRINDLARDLSQHLATRLAGADAGQLERYRLETDQREQLKRVYHITRRLAKRLIGQP